MGPLHVHQNITRNITFHVGTECHFSMTFGILKNSMTSPGLEISHSNSMTFPSFPWLYEPWCIVLSHKTWFVNIYGDIHVLMTLRNTWNKQLNYIYLILYLGKTLHDRTKMSYWKLFQHKKNHILFKFMIHVSFNAITWDNLRCMDFHKVTFLQGFSK